MTVATEGRARQRIGRFELRRELGRGAQATVWLGWDAHLEREVAVKLLDTRADSVAVNQWMHEARAVSQLTHPNIVPVFEAGEDQGRPYLVFEFVQGATLTEALRARGPWPGAEAATVVSGVLDALAAAHAAGIVHRDLKPSNILLGPDGRPRVMDFGIAARVDQRGDGLIVGTPGYMSPEAAMGKAPSPGMDVFAAGAVLAQMLTGEPVLRERDPYRAIERVVHEDLSVPTVANLAVDDQLRAIAQRALARDPVLRWDSAAEMRDALGRWLTPKPVDDVSAGRGSSTLDFLLRRMKHKSDFPALSDAVSRIQRVTSSDSASMHSLSEEILKDVALTNKLLRLANTAHFRNSGGGTINTVSRAAALVGFAGIRNLAMSLVLVEHMQDKSHAARLKDEFLRSLMAATLAGELCPVARVSEEAFLVGMMQNLGRLLTEYYFPEEAEQIRRTTWRDGAILSGTVEESAAVDTLGVGFDELGCGVARAWGLPDSMQKAMRRPDGPAPRQVQQGPEHLRWVGHAANQITLAVLNAGPGQQREAVAELADQFHRVIGLDASAVRSAAESARGQVAELSRALSLNPAPGSLARKLLTAPHPPGAPAASAAVAVAAIRPVAAAAPAGPNAASDEAATIAASTHGSSVVTSTFDRQKRADMLNAGILEITRSMAGDSFRLNEVLQSILRTMHQALALRRVVLCLRDPRGATLSGRFGLGDAADMACKAIRVPLNAAPPDLFAAVCLKGADLLVEDATAGNMAGRLPAWYRGALNAPSFLLLPLTMKAAPFGLIYADHAQAGGIHLGENDLNMLRTLRNQAVMAFKSAGAG